MKGCCVKTLGESVTHKKGKAFKSEWFQSSGYAIVKATNFTDNSISIQNLEYVDESIYNEFIEYAIHTNDVIIQTVGSWPNNPASVVGKVIRVPKQVNGSLLNQNAVLLKPKNEIDNSFFYYLLKSNSFRGYIINTAQGAANQANVTLDAIFRYSFYLPSLQNQRKIAAVLSAYDDLIENNNRRIAILEKIAEELYREWFVRLRFPGHEKVKIVKGVPEGWNLKKLPDVALITYGYPFEGSNFNTNGLGKPIIRIRNIPNASTSDYTTERADEKYIVNKGDLLVGMDGEFHINHWCSEDAYLVQRSCRIKAKNSILNGYLAKAIHSPIKYYESILQGPTVGHLGAKHLNSIEILIPPKYIDIEIFNKLLRMKIKLTSSNNQLKQIRDRLLTRLMSGKIDLEKLDIHFPQSMLEETAAESVETPDAIPSQNKNADTRR